MNLNKEIAVFGGGCFWCTEAIFTRVRGVISVTSGYAGGENRKPTFTQMVLGRTEHIEVIKIEFDSQIITYEELLDIFWHVHDPTSLDRQGADTGVAYRSIILTTNDMQYAQATTSKETLEASHEYKNPIVTIIQPLGQFYTAEEYNQKFLEKYPNQPYCELVIAPKIKKFLEKYGDKAISSKTS